MKKYLMTVMAAVALGGFFVGCGNDVDLNGGDNTAWDWDTNTSHWWRPGKK